MRLNPDRITALVVGGLVLAALTLVLLLPRDLLLAAKDTDMVGEFASSRAFLADSLRHGHLPLWNPYTYSGEPFLGDFESAALYPPNLVFLLLPLAPALNFSMLLHLIVLGWGMERWARFRGNGVWASALAGLVLALSGPVFPHLFAGHLSNFCTMAWAPWIFLGLERWTRQGHKGGLLLASAAICLQILAGHIQYFFYTAVAATLQAVILTIAEPALRRRALPAVAGCYLAGLALGAAQLLPGLAAGAEGVRQRALGHDFAAMFSFPPENFLTVLAPGFFGTVLNPSIVQPGQPLYWGRGYLWEMSLFFGRIAPLLIAVAVLARSERRREMRLDLLVAGVLLALALGAHTPLFNLLYWGVPGFGHFRAWSKFIFPAGLFLVQVLAAGLDHVLKGKAVPRPIAWSGIMTGLAATVGGMVLLAAPQCLTGPFQWIEASRESYLPASFFSLNQAIDTAGVHAGLSLVLTGLVLAAAGAALLGQERNPRLRWALPGLLALELIGFAAGLVPVAHLSDAAPAALRKFVAAHPGDYRVLNPMQPDNGFLLGARDAGGNNPFVLGRYAELLTFIRSGSPDHATQYLDLSTPDPLYALLRLRYIFTAGPDGRIYVAPGSTAPLPRLLLLAHAQATTSRDALFSALRNPAFDPRQSALLESPPEPAPQPGPTGTATLLADEPDELTLDVQTAQPALLLVTDLYDPAWRAEALPGSVQPRYQVLPADEILRAIPLMAGHHRLRLVYAPPSVPIGVSISLAAWLAWVIFLTWLRRRNHRPVRSSP